MLSYFLKGSSWLGHLSFKMRDEFTVFIIYDYIIKYDENFANASLAEWSKAVVLSQLTLLSKDARVRTSQLAIFLISIFFGFFAEFLPIYGRQQCKNICWFNHSRS